MKAFIFDFDGVVVDSEKHWDTKALGLYQSMVPAFTAEHDKHLKGRSVIDIYNWLCADFALQISREEYERTINKFAQEVYSTHAQLIPGFTALAKRLRHMQMPIGIASSSMHQWIDIACERLNIGHYFDAITTAEDVGKGKPDPAVYEEAARRLQTDPNDCVALEDSTNGILAAKAAGMFCIAIRHSWGHEQDLSHADRIMDHYDELTLETLANY